MALPSEEYIRHYILRLLLKLVCLILHYSTLHPFVLNILNYTFLFVLLGYLKILVLFHFTNKIFI